jgi:hypothetical protein
LNICRRSKVNLGGGYYGTPGINLCVEMLPFKIMSGGQVGLTILIIRCAFSGFQNIVKKTY